MSSVDNDKSIKNFAEKKEFYYADLSSNDELPDNNLNDDMRNNNEVLNK